MGCSTLKGLAGNDGRKCSPLARGCKSVWGCDVAFSARRPLNPCSRVPLLSSVACSRFFSLYFSPIFFDLDHDLIINTLLSPGSTAPFTAAKNHLLNYHSGMLQTWSKFCFSDGYIEVVVVLPSPDENTQGYASPFLSSRVYVPC